MGVERPVTGPGNEYYDAYLRETQIAPEDVIGAYGFNMAAFAGGALNMVPSPLFWLLNSDTSAMGYGCCTPLWYNPGSLFCGTMAGPFACCAGPAHRFAKGDLNWGSPSSALRSQFELQLKGEGMMRELTNAESKGAFKTRFLKNLGTPSLNPQAVHLNDTWAKEVNERLLMPAGYFCVLRNWEAKTEARGRGFAIDASFLQLLIVKGDEDAMKRTKAAAAAAFDSVAVTTTTMVRDVPVAATYPE